MSKIIDTDDLEQFASDLNGKLAKVATNGSYNDLSNRPSLAAVATSGNYSDLSNKPTIPDTSTFVNTTYGVYRDGYNIRTGSWGPNAGIGNVLVNPGSGGLDASVCNCTALGYMSSIMGPSKDSIAIGHASISNAVESIAIGCNVSMGSNLKTNCIAIGTCTGFISSASNDSIMIGTNCKDYYYSNAIAIGTNLWPRANSILIGSQSNGWTSGNNAILIGSLVNGTENGKITDNSIFIGGQLNVGSTTTGGGVGSGKRIVIGQGARHVDGGIVIGGGSSATQVGSIVIGHDSFNVDTTNISWSSNVLIGSNSTMTNCNNCILIGDNSYSGISTKSIGITTNGNFDASGIFYNSSYSVIIGGVSYTRNSSSSTGFGYGVGINKSTGGTSIGGSSSLTNGSYSIALGNSSYVQDSDNSVAIGYGCGVYSSSNTIQLGNNNIKSLKCKVSVTTTSDIRDKTDIVPIPHALDFINTLNPITYVRNDRSLYEKAKEDLTEEETEIFHKYGFIPYDKEEHSKGTKKGERRRAGLAAQAIREAMKEVYNDDSYANLITDDMFNHPDAPEGVESHLGVQYEVFVPFLIKAIQELSAKVDELEGKVK